MPRERLARLITTSDGTPPHLHAQVIDTGEEKHLREDITRQDLLSDIWWRHLLAGGAAGAVSRTCTAPLDRIKVYMQVNATRKNGLNFGRVIAWMRREGGVTSFWRGNGVNVAKIAPEYAVRFSAYEMLKRCIQRFKGNEELHVSERFVAGSSAGVISQSIIYPLEVLKTRLALRCSGQMNDGLVAFAHKMYTEEGFLCFYKGYVPNVLGIIPYAGIDLAVYETLKAYARTYCKEGEQPGVLALVVCGACSSTCGQLASYPLALVRTRLQARKVSVDPRQPDTMIGQFRYILGNEGFIGLYRGLNPTFLKVIPAVCISYVVYEYVREQLGAEMT